MLAFHGGFRMLFMKLFDEFFDDGVVIRRGGMAVTPPKDDQGRRAAVHVSGMNNPGEALFVAMRALLEGKQVLMAPDGPFGRQKASIKVLGADCPVGQGAAFLAFETRCNTAWFTIVRNDRGFAPLVVPGPKREERETFEAYQDRLHRFYGDMIVSAFTGEPRNLTLSGRWIQYFRSMLAARNQ